MRLPESCKGLTPCLHCDRYPGFPVGTVKQPSFNTLLHVETCRRGVEVFHAAVGTNAPDRPVVASIRARRIRETALRTAAREQVTIDSAGNDPGKPRRLLP